MCSNFEFAKLRLLAAIVELDEAIEEYVKYHLLLQKLSPSEVNENLSLPKHLVDALCGFKKGIDG